MASAEELPLFASDAGESLDIASDEGEVSAFVQSVEMADGDVAIGESAVGGLQAEGAGEIEETEKTEKTEKAGGKVRRGGKGNRQIWHFFITLAIE